MDKVALIMAGGSGTRFWPLSTNDKPKQFLDLVSEKTMIKETIDRIKEIIPVEKIFISTNIKYFDIIKKELPEIADRNIIFEPMARDTAACIGYAACIIRKIYKNSIMAVLPSDHLIKKEKEFLESLKFAFCEAQKNKIVTLGVKPTYAETGYGYIEYIDRKNKIKNDGKYIYVSLYGVENVEELSNKLYSEICSETLVKLSGVEKEKIDAGIKLIPKLLYFTKFIPFIKNYKSIKKIWYQ